MLTHEVRYEAGRVDFPPSLNFAYHSLVHGETSVAVTAWQYAL